MPTVQLMLVDAAAARLVPSVAMAVIGPSITQSAREIGNVSLIKVWVQGAAPQDSRSPLYRADDVIADETVETIEDAGLPVRFLDDTKLQLGSARRAARRSTASSSTRTAGQVRWWPRQRRLLGRRAPRC